METHKVEMARKQKEYRERNKAKIAAKRKVYVAKNREKINAAARAHKQKNNQFYKINAYCRKVYQDKKYVKSERTKSLINLHNLISAKRVD